MLEIVPNALPIAPPQRHTVQFYEDEASLTQTVATFVGAGLGAGDPVIIIATGEHRAAFCARLRAQSIDVEHAVADGQLTLLDARETLAKFMIDDEPDWDRFRSVIGGLLDTVVHNRRRQRVLAYGEMVDLLWRDGNRAAAIRLEELWNDLARIYSFELLCAYVLDNFYKQGDAAQLEKICDLHSESKSTEIGRLHERALALHNEIERRKKVEHELRQAQSRLTDFVENAPVPLHWIDADGKIEWANEAELELLGYARDEYLGHHISEFHVDRAVIDNMLQRLSHHETLREYPSRLRCKDGSIREVIIDAQVYVEDGKLVHSRCFTRDVTARLRENEMRMRLLIESVRDYAIFMLDPTGRVATWNPGAQRIKGYRANEIIGRHFSSFYPESDVAAGKCELELRVAAETGRFEDEGWRVRKDGSRFWANVIISAVRRENGELVGFSKVTRDLTERRRAEDERAALAASEQANRAKDEFLAMLGHELRNPLAPIVTALQLMKLRGDVSSSKEQVIIERQVQHVVRLVDDLLDVSRITQGKIELKLETFEMASVVAKAVEIASPLLEQRRHELLLDVPREGMLLHADPVRLSQVVANLLTNAAKYTDVGGRIEVRAWHDGHEIVLQVKDNGAGIRADLLPRMFDLFVQGERAVDRGQGGLGIGLTLVRSLVQMHGGTVVALSDGPGRGSAFVVRLPAAPARRRADAPAPTSKIVRADQPRRVLVVDDNADAATLLAELCATMGHEVRVAHDGPQALGVLAEFTPEVAVLDIGLPVMDGYELAKRIRASLPACRLVALTGYGQEHDHLRSQQAGFAAHLVKPVDPTRVLDIIADAESVEPTSP